MYMAWYDEAKNGEVTDLVLDSEKVPLEPTQHLKRVEDCKEGVTDRTFS